MWPACRGGTGVLPERIIGPLTDAIGAIAGPAHLDRLIDLVAATLPHDKVTVVRYSATMRPEFVSWRNYSAALVEKYLEQYYRFDPFYAMWRGGCGPGVVNLDHDDASRGGPYIADFLGESDISDEVGILLPDGGDWALGVFLDRSGRRFDRGELALATRLFPVFAALHAHDLARRGAVARRTGQPSAPGVAPLQPTASPEDWPELTPREVEIVTLVLRGHPPAGIAQRLGISAGTVKNHRRNIYEKLDITSERELFLRYLTVVAQRG
ncbi:MAG: helix-turn-helix transcriptional regulator [Rubellimicrobium sp.]|nr:helix-turn-helix transcriptional regulator [Rubellimicrobium sp.]